MSVLDILLGGSSQSPPAPAPNIVDRGNLMPFSIDDQGGGHFDPSAGLMGFGPARAVVPGLNLFDALMGLPAAVKGAAQSVKSAATLPGDVATGKLDPMSEEGIGRAAEMASMFGLVGLAMPKPAGSVGTFGGRLATEGSAATAPAITAYHGSPHSFDNFSLDHIGSGEGNQAYGHGLYFAEDEGVAKSYRDTLSKRDADLRLNNQGLRRGELLGDYQDAFDHIRDAGGKIETAIQEAKDASSKKLLSGDMGGADFWMKRAVTLQDMKGQGFALGGKGHMYEVGINADPEHFLQFDKPVSEQTPHVQDALTRLGLPSTATGYDVLHATRNGADLKAAGVSGIRYLDQGSRSAGSGSHNYVVFDDKTIDILRKYGLAGLGAGLGAYAFGSDGNGAAQAAPRK